MNRSLGGREDLRGRGWMGKADRRSVLE
jgi:hypothetical protein